VTDRRRFPPPWPITEHEGGAFFVVDASGQRLGTLFYRADEAGGAVNFARLPEFLKQPKS
jgi:hypothetical protein